MNRTFKRVISSVLAFVMVMSCMIVMNVGTAMGAELTTKEFELYVKSKDEWAGDTFAFSSDTVNTSNFFSEVGTTTATHSTSYGYTATTINSDSVALEYGIKLEGSKHPSFTIPEGVSNIKVNYAFSTNKDAGNPSSVKFGDINGNESLDAAKTTGYKEDEVSIPQSGTYEIKSNAGQAILLYAKVSYQVDESVATLSLSPATQNIAKGSTGTITADATGNVGNITWTSDKADEGITVEGTATSATVTVSASAKGGTLATITATPENCAAVTAKVVVIPTLDSAAGTEDSLAVTDTSTTYDLRAEAVKAGFGENYTGACYVNGNTFFNNHVASVGSNAIEFEAKATQDVDGTPQTYGIRLKEKARALAVKIPDGSTIESTFANGGSGERYGYFTFSKDSLTADQSTLNEANSVKVGVTSGAPQNLSYTNDTGADKVIYISGTGDIHITQIKVTVPESLAENEIKGVAYGDNYVVFGISAANAAKYNSYEIVGGTAEGGNTVYTGVEFAEGTKIVSEIPGIDTEYCVAYKFDNVDGNLDALVKAVKLSLK